MALKAPSKYSEKIYVTVYDVLEEHGFSQLSPVCTPPLRCLLSGN